jgi:hypothetical protein
MGSKQLDVLTRQESVVSDEVLGSGHSLMFLKFSLKASISGAKSNQKKKDFLHPYHEITAMILCTTDTLVIR